MTATPKTLEAFMNWTRERNPGQEEFHQAVEEVAAHVLPFIAEHREYAEARILERLTEPDRIISFRVSWMADDGTVQVNRGWRVQLSNAIGPYKGGLRFTPGVSESVLKFLAFEQAFKNALTGLPLGAGKGGADFDPRGRSDAEIMRFCQSFMTELHRHIGPEIDIPAGDINVGPREIGWLFGAYKRIENRFDGALTGKGASFGGAPLRPEATGYGLIYFTACALEAMGEGMDGRSVLISGAGNVATHAADEAIRQGGKVITLSAHDGCLHHAAGFSHEQINEVRSHKAGGGHIKDLARPFGAKWRADAKPWDLPGHIALPCATQNEMQEADAQALVDNGVLLVAEGANMPLTPDAMGVLRRARTAYAPGKATNAGGVAVSGMEMSQNAMHGPGDREHVCRRLNETMVAIHQRCLEHGRRKDNRIDYVKGANIAGFRKLADAMLAYGVV
ncbi:NADP-specific glutamate dehydrogenase [Glycocaulis profundi]|nr:NADP-specific glutamate dehydrogenase [Glycocaulis profundi]